MSSLAHAQFSLAKVDNTPITNGQIFTFNTTDENTATFHYKIKNPSVTSPINIRIKIVSIQNGTGSGFQFCYLNSCIPSVAVNAVYPSISNPSISISANSETSSAGYNMWNSNTGSGTFPIDYVVKFYQVDSGDNEIGNSVTITYRYNPNFLAVGEVKNNTSFANVSSTIVSNSIDILASENISYNLYSMEGRLISNGNIGKGEKSIDLSAQNRGVYILTLKNSQGKSVSKKIIKK